MYFLLSITPYLIEVSSQTVLNARKPLIELISVLDSLRNQVMSQ